MKTLNKNYTVEVDSVDKTSWTKILKRFDDANIYQTWEYCKIRRGEGNISHLILKHNGEILSACQIMFAKIPLINKGLAYVLWGPLWRKHRKGDNFEVFRQMLWALREEYVLRRGLFLRLQPHIIDDGNDIFPSIFRNEGFRLNSSIMPYRTLLLDLSLSLEKLREGLSRTWRRALKVAVKQGLKLIEGTGDQLYEVYMALYDEMINRKRIEQHIDIKGFRAMQEYLPNSLKMKIIICEYEGEPVATLIASLIGSTGIALVGATSKKGLNMGPFHLLNWRMLEWMKECGGCYYDFGGYDPDRYPGTSAFKSGSGGIDIKYIGQFEACENFISFLLVKFALACRSFCRSLRKFINRFFQHLHQ